MENPKYLIIITLIDGQNFNVPDGVPDKVDATVFAEARFGNESLLRSDPIKLVNSNPEFVTELVWQLDKKILHQLRVERKAIKLQVFMQTREKKRTITKAGNAVAPNGYSDTSSEHSGETHKVELIGYTILDLRSAQPKEHTRFQWYPLLNPKFRKSSYNRPEIQLAVIMSRSDDEDNANQEDSMNHFSSISTNPECDVSLDPINDRNNQDDLTIYDTPPDTTRQLGSNGLQSNETNKFYTTCLENSSLSNRPGCSDEIVDNDIIIRSKDGLVHIYDAKHPHKFTIDDCDERYRLVVKIPFTTNLETFRSKTDGYFYFSVSLFGITLKTKEFHELTNFDAKQMIFDIATTHAGVLATYFELKSNLDIELCKSLGDNDGCIALATVQLNQLCSLDTTCRSIEGIFSLQSPTNEVANESNSFIDHPSIGVSVVLKKLVQDGPKSSSPVKNIIYPNRKGSTEYECDDFEDYLNHAHDTHQLTLDASSLSGTSLQINQANIPTSLRSDHQDVIVADHNIEGPSQDDYHYCFTIDLKEFSYTPVQKLIPTLRELVIRYSYPFFGYKDIITTDASIPINSTSSIIVSGFCEFNFATTSQPLLTALSEIPLELDILAVDVTRLREIDADKNTVERVVANCSVNLADILELNESNIDRLLKQPASKTTSVPIFALDRTEIGRLELSLCLKNLGKPASRVETSAENVADSMHNTTISSKDGTLDLSTDTKQISQFINEAKCNLESWKTETLNKMSDEFRRRDNDRFKRLYQRIEAKELRRESEFKKKMEDLGNLERKFKTSLGFVDTIQNMLVESLEHLKTKNTLLNNRLDTIELKISQLSSCNGSSETNPSNVRNSIDEQQTRALASNQRLNRLQMLPQRSFDENILKLRSEPQQQQSSTNSQSSLISNSLQLNGLDRGSPRRSSLRTTTGALSTNPKGQIPVAARSTSLVRRPSEGSATVTRFVKRNSGTVTPATAMNDVNSRIRSNTVKFSLSKENQEKLANLRKEKAELLKRGCKPTDELIREINSLIEKLAC